MNITRTNALAWAALIVAVWVGTMQEMRSANSAGTRSGAAAPREGASACLRRRLEVDSSRELNQRACDLISDGKYRDALELLNQSYMMVTRNGNRTRGATIMENMAEAYKGLGRLDYAKTCAKKAEELFAPPETPIPVLQARCYPVPQYIYVPVPTPAMYYTDTNSETERGWGEDFPSGRDEFVCSPTRNLGMGGYADPNSCTEPGNEALRRHDLQLDAMQNEQFAAQHAAAEQAVTGTSYMSRRYGGFGR